MRRQADAESVAAAMGGTASHPPAKYLGELIELSESRLLARNAASFGATYDAWLHSATEYLLTAWRNEVQRRVAEGGGSGNPVPPPLPYALANPPHPIDPQAAPAQHSPVGPPAIADPQVPVAPSPGTATATTGQFDAKDRSPDEDQFAAKDFTPDADGFI